MTGKSRLGKGLDALIPPGESPIGSTNIVQINAEQIQPNPYQPRIRFSELELAELANSIRLHGVIQPLLVRKESEGKYTLIAGERRLQAAKLANLETVPAVLRDAEEQDLVELALIENVQREDLSPLEAAEAYRQLHENFSLSHKEIAKQVGKSRVTITNTLGLLELSAKVKEALAEGKITEGHGRALKALEKGKAQLSALSRILKNDLNVRQTEELIRKLLGRTVKTSNRKQLSPEMKSLQVQLMEALGTKVSLFPTSKGGRIALHYYSDEELNSLIEKLIKD